tara:strand:+ start:5831 stop:12373 length:6543 start_codon:yes stop_codon:yes gene_type:complete
MANATATQLQQLYVAYFGRAADPAGLDYWVAEGTTTKAFAASQYAQEEFKNEYSSLSTILQVNQIYNNLLGRDGDTDGLIYWVNKINTGEMELASIANDIIYSINNDPKNQADVDALANKTAAAVTYTADIRASDSAFLGYNPESTTPWVTGTNFTTAKTFFTTVTATNAPTDDEIADNVAVIAANSSNTATSDTSFTLTTGVDNPSTTYATFDGSLTSSGSQTLGSLDRLTGSTGTSDVLNATIKTSVTPASISGVETINIVGNAADITLGLVNASGLTTVNAGGASGKLTLSGLSTSTTVTISDAAVDHTLTYSDVGGSSDTATISLSQVTGGSLTEIDVVSIETITLTSAGGSGSNSIELEAPQLTTLTVDGSGDLTLSSLATGGTTKLKSIDASAMTGALDVTTGALSLGTSVLTITGGSGNDSVDSSGHTGTAVSIDGGSGNDTVTIALDTDDTIDGGTGTDNLITTSVISAAGNVSGFETFTLDVTAGSLNQDFDNLSGNTFTKLVATGDGGTGDDGTFTDIPSTITDLELASTASGDFVLDRKTDTSSDAVTVTVKGDTTAILTANHEEEITVVSSTSSSQITTLNAADLTKITVSGSANALIPTIAGNTSLATVDASESTGAVTVATTNASVVPMTITAGSGGFTGAGGTKADTFTGGTGDDSIAGAAGADSLTGGAGADSLDGGGGNDIISGGAGNDSITAGAGTDNLDGGADNDTFVFGTNYGITDTVAGGEGTDTVTMTLGANTTFDSDTMSGVENFTLTHSAANTYDFKNLTGVEEVTIADGSAHNQTVQGLNSGVTVNILEATNIATIDTLNADSVSIDVEVTKTGGSVAVTDTASVTITGKANVGDIQALALDAVDTTTLSLASGDTNDLDVGAITNTDKLATLNLTTAEHTGTVATATIVDATSLATINATGVGGDITTTVIGGTDAANVLTAINATATVGSTITFGNITADTTDSVTDNDMVITTSATGVDSGNGNSMNIFGFVNNQYGTITLNNSGDTADGTTTGDLTAVDVTVTSSGGDITIGDVSASEDFTLTVTGGTATVTDFDAETFSLIDASASSGKLTVTGTSSDGNITVIGGSAGDAITVATAIASGKVHSLSGGDGADTITGSSGAETIVGGAGNDSLDGAAGNDNISGGAGNDTFSFAATGQLNAGDTVDGGDGTDNLDVTSNVNLDSSATASTSVTLTSIETVDITLGADNLSFDAANWASLTGLTISSGTDTYTPTINNLPTGVTVTLGSTNVDETTLDTVAGADLTVDAEAAALTSLTITDAENVTINGEGATADLVSLVLDATDTKTLTLTADGGTSLDTGAITGTDEITTITATTTVASGTITTGGGAIADVDGLTSLNLTATNANLTIGAMGTDATANNAELLSTITAEATGTGVTLSTGALYADSTVDSTSDLAMTLNLTTNVGARNNIGAIDNTYGSITSTIVSNSSDDTDIGNLTSVAQTHTVSGGGDTDFAGITASGAVTVTSTGSGNLTISDANVDGTSASLSVDASAMSGTANVVATNSSVATTLTGGQGADTLTGGSVADSITGGAGADTLTTNGGDDTVAGGAGNDTIAGGAGDNVITGGGGNDSITAGAGFDSINAGAGDDTIVLAANISLSDSVDGGEGNDTVTATISKGSTGQKIGTMSNVEVATLTFDQTAGSLDATGFTTINAVTTADTDDIDIDSLTTAMTLNIKDSADQLTLDYTDDATATIVFDPPAADDLDGAFAVTDAQTVNISTKGGYDYTAGSTTTLDATDTDYLTITAGVADSGYINTGNFIGAKVQTATLTSSNTGAPITLSGQFLNAAGELTTLTVSATDGDDSSDITFGSGATGAGTAANKLTSVDLDASHGADITTGAISGSSASLTSITADATTTGSIITTGALTLGSVSNITTSAVSGAEVDLAGAMTISTVGTIKHTGAGNFRMDSTSNAITTLERLDLTDATGTNAVDLAGNTNAVTVNLGTGADTVILSGAADDVNLSSTASVDTLEYTESTSTTAIASVSNFAFASGGDIINIDLTDMEAANVHTAARSTDIIDGNAVAVTGTGTVKEISGDTTIAAGDDVLVFTRTTYTASQLVTAVEGGDDGITTSTALTANDALLAFYSDGTDMYLAMITYINIGTAAAAWDSGDACEVKNLMKFEGVQSIASGDISTGDVVIV